MNAIGHFIYENLGWFATAVFTTSFFFKSEVALLRTQLFGALMWIVYGFMMSAYPVVAANMLVAGASIFKQVRLWLASRQPQGVQIAKAA